MKKLIAFAVLVVGAAALTFSAQETQEASVPVVGPYNWRTMTEAQWREVLDTMLAQETVRAGWAVGRASVTNGYGGGSFAGFLSRRRDLTAFRLEADAAFTAHGYVANWTMPCTWPRLSAAHRAVLGADEPYAQSLAIATRLRCDLGPQTFLVSGGTLDDIAVFLSEAVAFPTNCTFSPVVFNGAKAAIQKKALGAVKAYIRSQGRSFVTKDGVNPCEEYMTRLTTVLNAPRFAGLDEWFKSVGLKGIDLSRMPSEAEITQLKEDILYGRVDINDRHKAMLVVCLGVEGYNAFIREYNGD